jgi:hypothetical protein
MRGEPSDPFVYLHRWRAHGTYYPWRYGHTIRHGRGIGRDLESVFVGTERQVRDGIREGRLQDLPWDTTDRSSNG